METPLNKTDPWLGRSKPAQMPIRVVLPLPEGPTMAQALPCSISKETSLRTVRVCWPLLKYLLKCSTFKMVLFFMVNG